MQPLAFNFYKWFFSLKESIVYKTDIDKLKINLGVVGYDLEIVNT